MQVYIEYVIIDNLIINYILLYSSARCAQVKTKALFLFLSALLGTVVAVILPLINLKSEFLIFIKLPLGALMVLLSAKFLSLNKYLLTFFFFLTFTFLSGGLIIATFNLIGVDYTLYYSINYNSFIPVGVSVAFVFFATRISVKIVKSVIKERDLRPFLRKCIIVVNKKRFTITGFIDSGNRLYDERTGFPVIVASLSLSEKLLGAGVRTSVSELVVDTVSGKTKLKLYVIDKLLIYNGEKVNIFNNVLVGASPYAIGIEDGFELLIHPSLI